MYDPLEYQHPAHCPEGGFITIQPGYTISGLALYYHTTVEAILAANPGIDPNNLQVGQLICIPNPTPGQPFYGPCPNASTYVVKSGDTFYSIARRFNVSLDALLRANPDVNPDFLRIGQLICIPTLPTPTVTCPGPTYTVRPGDTIYGLAQALGFTVQAILAANPGIDPNALMVGQVLCLPLGGAVPCAGGTIYRIQPGDTLYSIARRFDVTLDKLLAANPGLSSGSVIYPGQMICIPIREI